VIDHRVSVAGAGADDLGRGGVEFTPKWQQNHSAVLLAQSPFGVKAIGVSLWVDFLLTAVARNDYPFNE
jgi:hypothetical protein